MMSYDYDPEEEEGINFDEWTLSSVYKKTSDILKELPINVGAQKKMFDSLTKYRFVDDPYQLAQGAHIRYISLNIDPNDAPKLSPSSAIFCKINDKRHDDGCTWIICKTYYGRHFQLCFGHYLIFQKFTGTEQMLIQTAEFLS
jgi:hypothetical protein